MRISDWSSDVCSSDLAELLAERRRQVTVLEPGPAIGLPMASPRRWATVRKATAHGVELVRGAEVKEITASDVVFVLADGEPRSEEHTSELQSLMRISYAVFCLKKKTTS